MVKFFDFINESKEAFLRQRSQQSQYKSGDMILSEGEEHHALFLIRKGVVRIELEHPEFNIEITRLTAGEIFGEMSFLEGFNATANVIADEDVDIEIVHARDINELIEKDSGFIGRFYKPLAQILCTRLRDTTLRGFG